METHAYDFKLSVETREREKKSALHSNINNISNSVVQIGGIFLNHRQIVIENK